MRLFCIPYAGGSEAIYSRWYNYVNSDIKVEPIPLKGRGSRFGEEFYSTMEEAVDDIYNIIKDKITVEEYAIYGHSMGSVLAYELYYKIIKEGKNKPRHIFFSGRRAPNTINENKNSISYKLPDDKFMNKIVEMGGTPKELLENKELLEIFTPILKNDMKILEEYKYKERKEKIKCNISVINGTYDNVKYHQKVAWKDLCEGQCQLYDLKGNHFFINDNVENISNIIEKNLLF